MAEPVHYIPIVTTLFAAWFSPQLVRRWRARRPAPHLAWWAAGVALYGLGTLTESLTTLLGWQSDVFRLWYVSGALLGGMPLAQGTAYLVFRRRTANILTAVLMGIVIPTAILVLLSPLDLAAVEMHRLSGAVLEWQWVRGVSPFINSYAFVMLVGGAIASAWKFRRTPGAGDRVRGNVFIAIGAILPGIGGSFTRFGHVEVLYVTELLGLALIYTGFRHATRTPAPATVLAAVPR